MITPKGNFVKIRPEEQSHTTDSGLLTIAKVVSNYGWITGISPDIPKEKLNYGNGETMQEGDYVFFFPNHRIDEGDFLLLIDNVGFKKSNG